MTQQHITIKTKLAIATSIFLWASAFVGIRAGLQQYSPGGLALLRFIVASICMGLVYLKSKNRSDMLLRDKCSMLCMGAIGIGVYNICLNYGETVVSSGVASFVISQSPVFTAIIAVIFLGERITWLRILGFVISIFGVVLITCGKKEGFSWDISVLYILVATLAGSYLSVMQKPFLRKYNAIESTTYIIWGGTLFLLFFTPQLYRDLTNATFGVTAVVIYLGIFPASVGYLSWSYALSTMPASRVVSFLYFIPFIATLLGWLLLGEVPALFSIIGGVFAVAGVWVVNHSYRMPKVV